jgi:hypothetical protein
MLTTPERDALRLLKDALQATSASTFISSTNQIWISDRLKTAQALLATSISNEGSAALVHVTRARNFVEAIEAPRLRQSLQSAIQALTTPMATPGLGRGYAGEEHGAALPDGMTPEGAPGPAPAPAATEAPAPKSKRGVGVLLLAAGIVGAVMYARRG